MYWETAHGAVIENMAMLNGVRGVISIKQGGNNATIRNNYVNGCGRIQIPASWGGGTDAKGSGIGTGGSNIVIEHNVIENCRAVGITNMQQPGAQNVTIRYNIVRNTGPFAKGLEPAPWIQTWSSAINVGATANAQVYNNLVYNTTGCLRMWSSSTNLKFYNNTCHNFSDVPNTDQPVQVDDGSTADVRNNIISGVPVGKQAIFFGGPGSSQSNNLINSPVLSTFENAAAGNFKVLSGSAAIDQGTNVGGSYDRDFAGVQRPQGCCYDIGAYEYLSSGIGLMAPVNVAVIP
jgi:hypothetical protein